MTEDTAKDYKTLFKGIETLVSEPMARHTSFGVGGPAEVLVLPETKQDVARILRICREERLKTIIVGGGTNILVPDSGIAGVVIRLLKLKQKIVENRPDSKKVLLDIPAGYSLASVLRLCSKSGLEGAEFAAGIPGTIGGAVRMNAGTPTGSMSDIVASVEVTDSSGETNIIPREHLDFSYRCLDSINGVITGVSLLLAREDRKVVRKRIYRNYIRKKTTQPLLQKSAGCFFKNPVDGKPAGELIERCGLKGVKIGGAMVSPIHANFIVNTGSAVSRDILKLKDFILKEVFREFSIELQPEVIIKDE
ncbi:MAG: UDP-N-acetylmuramate dehydrogenase [Desulfobacteraceae bacterium]